MAVTSRELQNVGKLRHQVFQPSPGARAYPAYRTSPRMPYLLTGLLCVVALALVANNLVFWAQTRIDDVRYGRPRTSQLSGLVGHNEAGGTPTQFIAMNLNRRVVVVEIPGGDVSKTRTLTGPYLFGANEDLTPVTLRLAYVNADRDLDLMVNVKNEEIIYINENGNFRLINDGERASYEGRQQ